MTKQMEVSQVSSRKKREVCFFVKPEQRITVINLNSDYKTALQRVNGERGGGGLRCVWIQLFQISKGLATDNHFLSKPRYYFLSEKSWPVPLSHLAAIFCCQMLCLSMLGEGEIYIAREEFTQQSRHEQMQWVLKYLHLHSTKDDANHRYSFIVGTTTVCTVAWRLVLGVSRARFYRARKLFEG